MNTMYEIIDGLCKERGMTITKMCADAGISRSVMSELKAGRTKRLSNKYLPILSAFFGVTVDYLLGAEQKENHPAKTGEVDDEAIKFALFGGGPVTDAQFEEVKRFARFIKERDADGGNT